MLTADRGIGTVARREMERLVKLVKGIVKFASCNRQMCREIKF